MNENINLVIIFSNKSMVKKIFKNKKYLNKFKGLLNIYTNQKNLDEKVLKKYLKEKTLKIIFDELNDKLFEELKIKKEELEKILDKNKVYVLVIRKNNIEHVIEL